MASGVPFPLRLVGTAVSILGGGFLILQLASSAVFASLSAAEEAKQRKFALPCRACKGKGFYTCKLCKGNSTIKWSPLYDPVAINPCLCPTCDGNGVQRCLNCIGKGYF